MTPSTPTIVQPVLPEAPTKAPVFGEKPSTKKPKPKSATATFLGPDASPSVANAGYKSLTGQ